MLCSRLRQFFLFARQSPRCRTLPYSASQPYLLRLVGAGRAPVGYPHLSGPTPRGCDGCPVRPEDLETGRFTDLFRVMKVSVDSSPTCDLGQRAFPGEKGEPCVWSKFQRAIGRSGSVGGLIASFAGRHAKRTLPRAHIGCPELPPTFLN